MKFTEDFGNHAEDTGTRKNLDEAESARKTRYTHMLDQDKDLTNIVEKYKQNASKFSPD